MYLLINSDQLAFYQINNCLLQYQTQQKMKKRLSPTKSKVIQELSQRQENEENRISSINRSAQSSKYLCHYNNAIYMGGMSSYKKHGKGVIIHDDGSSVISEYLHDTPTGQTIIFRQNSIASMLFSSPRQFDIAYKQGHYILTIPFVDNSFKAHGSGILIDYLDHKIFRLTFKSGSLVQKILHLDKGDNQDAFRNNSITKIIGVKHEQAFSLTFERPSKVHVKTERNKTVIGYFDEVGELNGLGFTFYSQNLSANGERPLYLKSIERGYYRNSKLELFGDKIFSNGNKYIGQFEKGVFQGYGMLVCPQEMKWVYGRFIKGQLDHIEDSNYQQHDQIHYNVWSENLKLLHRRYRERWIDQDIDLPDQYYLYTQLKKSLEKELTHVDHDRSKIMQEDSQNLSRIQYQFEKERPGTLLNSKVEKELDYHYKTQTPKGPIKIEELAPILARQGTPSTPVNKFLTSSMASKTRQDEYRMQDPFKIDLIEVPIEKGFSRDEPQPSPLNSNIDNKLQKDNSNLYSSNKGRYNYKYIDQDEISPYRTYDDQVYTRALVHQLRKSRQKLKQSLQKLEENQRENYRKIRQTSPTRWKQLEVDKGDYPERYVGKITNKKHFNYGIEDRQIDREKLLSKYPTVSKYQPTGPNNYYGEERSRSPASLYPSFKTSSSPPKQSEQLYSERKKFVPSNSKGQSGSNFIKNNYKYWS